MMRCAKTALLLFSSAFLSLSAFAEAADAFAIPRAEFAKYYTAVTGKPVPEGAVRFTGGLSNLALLAKRQGASVSARTGGRFTLSLRFPKTAG